VKSVDTNLGEDMSSIKCPECGEDVTCNVYLIAGCWGGTCKCGATVIDDRLHKEINGTKREWRC